MICHIRAHDPIGCSSVRKCRYPSVQNCRYLVVQYCRYPLNIWLVGATDPPWTSYKTVYSLFSTRICNFPPSHPFCCTSALSTYNQHSISSTLLACRLHSALFHFFFLHRHRSFADISATNCALTATTLHCHSDTVLSQ
jgi:hypothetical protein